MTGVISARTRHWPRDVLLGGLLLVVAVLLAAAATGRGTLPGDVSSARSVPRLDNGLLDVVATVANGIGSLYGVMGAGLSLAVVL